MLLAKNMTPQAMATYYKTGGLISEIMAVTGKSYMDVRTLLVKEGVTIKSGGYRLRRSA